MFAAWTTMNYSTATKGISLLGSMLQHRKPKASVCFGRIAASARKCSAFLSSLALQHHRQRHQPLAEWQL